METRDGHSRIGNVASVPSCLIVTEKSDMAQIFRAVRPDAGLPAFRTKRWEPRKVTVEFALMMTIPANVTYRFSGLNNP